MHRRHITASMRLSFEMNADSRVISPTLYVIEQHDQLLDIWREEGASGLRIVHLDFHCDMRGLLVNRLSQRAYRSSRLGAVDEGNFYTHAIMEGRVCAMHWIHDNPGGRKHDVGTIRYTEDLTAQPLRWKLALQRERGIPFEYEVTPVNEWSKRIENAFLDIDWDFFASKEYDIETIDDRVRKFFGMEIVHLPENIALCYSPRYSHPSREQFEEFVESLSLWYGSNVVRLPQPQIPESPSLKEMSRYGRLYCQSRYLLRHIHYVATLWLRKRGVY